MTESDGLRIPKIIHYCWFGGAPLPESAVRYMTTWRKHLPDYRIIEWNETNFNLHEYTYAQEAYGCGKFAFVADVARLHALNVYGGVYLDTDVEVLQSFSRFLHHHAFSGFEDGSHIQSAIMGSEPHGAWVRSLLNDYRGVSFIRGDGEPDLTTNVERITRKMRVETDLQLDDSFQDFSSLVTIYPSEFFCPKSYTTGIIHRTRLTYAVHHFDGSWQTPTALLRRRSDAKVYQIFGEKLGRRVLRAKSFANSSGLMAAARYIIGGLMRSAGLKKRN